MTLNRAGNIKLLTKARIVNRYLEISKTFPTTDPEILKGIALIKEGFVLSGLRFLKLRVKKDELKKFMQDIEQNRKGFLNLLDFTNSYFQLLSVKDKSIKLLAQEIGLLGEFPKIDGSSILFFDRIGINKIVVNGSVNNVSDSMFKNNELIGSISYYLTGDVLVFELGKRKFFLPGEVAEFVDDSYVKILLSGILDSGFESERVYFLIEKVMNPYESSKMIDPKVKILNSIIILENRDFIRFFYEFIDCLVDDFGVLKSHKNILNNYFSSTKYIWLFLEIKNLASSLSIVNPSPVLSDVVEKMDELLEEIDIEGVKSRFKVFTVFTPLLEMNKYINDVSYLDKVITKRINFNSSNKSSLIVEVDGLKVGEINPLTSEFIVKNSNRILGVEIHSNRNLTRFIRNSSFPYRLDTWLEIKMIS